MPDDIHHTTLRSTDIRGDIEAVATRVMTLAGAATWCLRRATGSTDSSDRALITAAATIMEEAHAGVRELVGGLQETPAGYWWEAGA